MGIGGTYNKMGIGGVYIHDLTARKQCSRGLTSSMIPLIVGLPMLIQ